MPTLYYAPASPYSAKVRMAAALAGVAIEERTVDTSADPAELIAANPLGKIPVIVHEDGRSVFDSRAILQDLNRLSKNRVFPSNAAKRAEAERLEALADGVCDCLLAMVYERRSRPEDKVHAPWIDRQWQKASRGLDALEASVPRGGSKIHGGHAALRSLIGYLDLRFSGKWEKGRPKLRRWARAFDARHPELAAFAPR